MGPASPLGPSMPIAPGNPGFPGSPGGPGGPSSPTSPGGPRLPLRPGAPGGQRQLGSTSLLRLRRLVARNADESRSAASPSLLTSSWYVRSSRLATLPSRAFTLNRHNASMPSAMTSTATKLTAIHAGSNQTRQRFSASVSFPQVSVVTAVSEPGCTVSFILVRKPAQRKRRVHVSQHQHFAARDTHQIQDQESDSRCIVIEAHWLMSRLDSNYSAHSFELE